MILTNDSEHAGGLGGSGITFVLSLIVEHRLVDDEDPLDSLSDNLVLLSFPDLAAILEPTNLVWEKLILSLMGCHVDPFMWSFHF